MKLEFAAGNTKNAPANFTAASFAQDMRNDLISWLLEPTTNWLVILSV